MAPHVRHGIHIPPEVARGRSLSAALLVAVAAASIGLATPAVAVTLTDVGVAIPGTQQGFVAWGDYDQDGDLDILMLGRDTFGIRHAAIYRNDGGNAFTDIGAGLPAIAYGSAAWLDLDNDGDLDAFVSGEGVARAYRNDAGAFVGVDIAHLCENWSAAAWGDLDNDGDPDLALTGCVDGAWATRLYRNDGAFTFTQVPSRLPGIANTPLAWGDMDADGDLDLVLAGTVFRNDGWALTDLHLNLRIALMGAVALGDYDSDGDLDLAVSGGTLAPVTTVYRNDGGATFTEIGAALPGVTLSSLAWGDYDNDGDLDLALAGSQDSGPAYASITRVYRNDGGLFTDAALGLPGVYSGSLAWGDLEGDGDLDLVMMGWDGDADIARVYRSDGAPPNSPPEAPSGPESQIDGDLVTLSWFPSRDTETRSAALSYSVRVGTTPGASDLASAMADGVTGRRLVPQPGSIQGRTAWTLRLPAPSTRFYWSVQAVDASHAGSPFARDQVGPTGTMGTTTVCSAAGAQGNLRVSPDGVGGAIVVWEDRRGGAPDIYAHHLLAGGAVDPDWPVDGRALCTAPGDQTVPMIVSDGAGGAIVAWEDGRGGDVDVYAQHVLATGVVDPAWPADGRAICAAVGDQRDLTIDTDGASGALIAWQDARGGADLEVYVQHVLASGDLAPAWPTDGLALAVGGDPALVSDAHGGAIVVYAAEMVRAKHLLGSGDEDPAWPPEGLQPLPEGPMVYEWRVVPDGSGGAIIVDAHEGYRPVIDAHDLRPDGTIAWTESFWYVSLHHGLDLLDAAADDHGGVVVAWQDLYLLDPPPWPGPWPQWQYTMGVLSSGMDALPPFRVSTTDVLMDPVVATDGSGGLLVAWRYVWPLQGATRLCLQHVLKSGLVDPLGAPYGKTISTSADGQQMVPDGRGGAHLIWQTDGGTSGADLVAVWLMGPAPTDALVSVVSTEATPDRVRLEWSVSGAAGVPATIYRRTEQEPWAPVGSARPDGTTRIVFVDDRVVGGTRYGYRLGIADAGAERQAGETWIDVPQRAVLALRPPQPNPSAGDLQVTFSLATDQPALLEMLDVSGRRVAARQVGALGSGSHRVTLVPDRRLASGIYFVRLSQGKHSLVARAVVAR